MDKLSSKFMDRPDGTMYAGEVTLKASDLEEAVAAAERLTGKHIYDKVEINGDSGECMQFASDVVKVAEVFKVLTSAITKANPLSGEVV